MLICPALNLNRGVQMHDKWVHNVIYRIGLALLYLPAWAFIFSLPVHSQPAGLGYYIFLNRRRPLLEPCQLRHQMQPGRPMDRRPDRFGFSISRGRFALHTSGPCCRHCIVRKRVSCQTPSFKSNLKTKPHLLIKNSDFCRLQSVGREA